MDMEREIPIRKRETKIHFQLGLQSIQTFLTFKGPIMNDTFLCEIGQRINCICIVMHNVPIPSNVAKDFIRAFYITWG